jgi:hypothetical protein
VFVGIPNLSNKDKYTKYHKSVLNHIDKQDCPVTILKPYTTPPHAGKYKVGERSRLEAIAERMNVIVDKFMASDAHLLWIIDGDVEVPPHALDTLIRHNVDIASGVYPFHNFDSCNSMMFGRMDPENACGFFIPRDWKYMKGEVFGEEYPISGGTGCLLVKRRVFRRYHPKIPALRFIRDGDCGMDVLFWKRTQDAGFKARLDANVVCGHLPSYKLSKIDEWLT